MRLEANGESRVVLSGGEMKTLRIEKGGTERYVVRLQSGSAQLNGDKSVLWIPSTAPGDDRLAKIAGRIERLKTGVNERAFALLSPAQAKRLRTTLDARPRQVQIYFTVSPTKKPNP